MPLFSFGRAFAARTSRFDFGRSWLLLHFCCRTLRILATEVAREFASVIRVDLRVVLTARDRHIRETVVNQQFALVCVHVNQNSVRGLSLAAVAGDGVSVVEMRMLADIESNFATGVHPDFEIAGMADSFDSAEFSVSNL